MDRRAIVVTLAATILLAITMFGPAHKAVSEPSSSRLRRSGTLAEATFWDGFSNVTVYTYTPSTMATATRPVFFIIHGASKNADEYRDFAIPLAERHNAIIAAPLFNEPAFSRGGADPVARGDGHWSFAHATVLFEAVMDHFKATSSYLIGHSAGGQFVHRYATLNPGFHTRIVALNSGSYAFPTPDISWPYGLGGLGLPRYRSDALTQTLLAAPFTLMLGEADVKQNAEAGKLDVSEQASLQGPNRHARGLRYFQFCKALAEEKKWPFKWRLVEVPGVGHDGKAMLRTPLMDTALLI